MYQGWGLLPGQVYDTGHICSLKIFWTFLPDTKIKTFQLLRKLNIHQVLVCLFCTQAHSHLGSAFLVLHKELHSSRICSFFYTQNYSHLKSALSLLHTQSHASSIFYFCCTYVEHCVVLYILFITTPCLVVCNDGYLLFPSVSVVVWLSSVRCRVKHNVTFHFTRTNVELRSKRYFTTLYVGLP